MHTPFFARAKKQESHGIIDTSSPVLAKDAIASSTVPIRHLIADEFRIVAGAPQVQNEPEG